MLTPEGMNLSIFKEVMLCSIPPMTLPVPRSLVKLALEYIETKVC